MLPLKFIRVSDQMSICATRIVAIMSTQAYQARRLIKDEKRADTLLNAAGRDAVRSAIILDNGAVVASPLSIGQLLNNISKADAKSSKGKTIRLSHGLKLYDVIPDEIYNGDVEDEPEIDAELFEEETEDEEKETNEDETEEKEDEEEEEEETDDVLDIAWDGEVGE